jgi:hypothetical protein
MGTVEQRGQHDHHEWRGPTVPSDRARSVDLFAPIWIGPEVAVGDQWFALTDHKRLDC